jgi:hypothetical protein
MILDNLDTASRLGDRLRKVRSIRAGLPLIPDGDTAALQIAFQGGGADVSPFNLDVGGTVLADFARFAADLEADLVAKLAELGVEA